LIHRAKGLERLQTLVQSASEKMVVQENFARWHGYFCSRKKMKYTCICLLKEAKLAATSFGKDAACGRKEQPAAAGLAGDTAARSTTARTACQKNLPKKVEHSVKKFSQFLVPARVTSYLN
jgi:hypothetical protein